MVRVRKVGVAVTIKRKICLLGAFSVGKTSLVLRFVQSLFSEKYHTTVGVKVDKKDLTLDGREISLLVWDIHGEDSVQGVSLHYLRGAAGCLLVVDGTRPATLQTALDLRRRAFDLLGDVPCVMLLNKSDLTAEWALDEAELARLAGEGLRWLRTSAKSGQGVEAAFTMLARAVAWP